MEFSHEEFAELMSQLRLYLKRYGDVAGAWDAQVVVGVIDDFALKMRRLCDQAENEKQEAHRPQ